MSDHLYMKLIEECAEVQQRVCKLLQFGPDQRQDQDPVFLSTHKEAPPGTNYERLAEEVRDLISVIEFIGFRPPTQDEMMAKRLKIERYYEYSTTQKGVSNEGPTI
jgi:hypothetical protein